MVGSPERIETAMAQRSAVAAFFALAMGTACTPPASGPPTLRLVTAFNEKRVEGSSDQGAPPPSRTEWRFDGAAPSPGPSPAPFASTRGFEAGSAVSGLAVKDGLLVGHTTGDIPILHLERTRGLDNGDQLYAFEIRMRVSRGSNLLVVTRPTDKVDLDVELRQSQRLPWVATTPVVPGDKLQTYTITPPAPLSGGRIRHLLIRPTDVAGAEFAIESVRLVFRREHLAQIPSGVSWQGLRDIFRETLVTRSPETVRFPVTLPSRPLLDLAVGTPEDGALSFRVGVRKDGQETTVLSRTVTTPHRWERAVLDLAAYAGSPVEISFSASADRKGRLAFWGAPVVRQKAPEDASGTPRGVILIQGDTLRADHLELFGYDRKTAPTLSRLAAEGVLFRNAVTQTTWTKAATPSILTSLYPTTHGVHQIPDRLPSSAVTVAEAYRDAGYATLSLSSVAFTGAFTNLHQGFEELHESESTAGRAGPKGSKTAREFVDRLLPWIEDHKDVPFFVYLHFFDPHPPYEPYPPYDTMWADPKGREEFLREQEALKKAVSDAFLAQRGMATPEELRKAGVDPEAYLRYCKDWYDGSIRGMDAELGRLLERLSGLGLAERTVIAFYADHGEEFHEHGRMWHGQSLYGELLHVPLILWGPGHVPAKQEVKEPVELIDVVPTLLDLSGLPAPKAAQGQSLRPLFSPGGGWKARPAIAERQPLGGADFPNAAETYAIVDGGYKLIHNVVRPPGTPEFELFDFDKDPLDQKDLAAEKPEVVERLQKILEAWHRAAKVARLPPDSEITKGMSAEQLEQLRSLGYVK
jgi:arylsulfatase A-like enzyme